MENKKLEDNDLEVVSGGIKAKYVGGARNGKNRCKAEDGQWIQRCDSPNLVNVGKPFYAEGGYETKTMICLNCGAAAQFWQYVNGNSDSPWHLDGTKMKYIDTEV